MARLSDPRQGADRELLGEMERMAAVRSHSDGRAELGSVYVAMFNNPEVARRVGALGEHLRFGGSLPDAIRETVILRYAARCKLGYEWAHHVRPAKLAGVPSEVIDALAGAATPTGLSAAQRAAVEAVDQVIAGREISAETQSVLVESFGAAGAVELVALCGLYALMGYMVDAFAIEIEPGLPEPPFAG